VLWRRNRAEGEPPSRVCMMKSVWADRSVAALALKSRAGQQKKHESRGSSTAAGVPARKRIPRPIRYTRDPV
jgi:hypothetical protein